jgi:MoxR-like ATPase
MQPQRFEGTETYVATQDLQVAVNAAIALERPLLIKGEPGTGKTILAHEVATASSATSGCMTLPTTSSRANCGRRSRRTPRQCC